MDNVIKIPIIDALTIWLRDQNQNLRMTVGSGSRYVNIYHEKSWLGVVALIYPDQGEKQGLQHDWYSYANTWPLIHNYPDARYYRNVWQVVDPASFGGILSTALNLRDGTLVKWHEVYRTTAKGIVLLEKSNA